MCSTNTGRWLNAAPLIVHLVPLAEMAGRQLIDIPDIRVWPWHVGSAEGNCYRTLRPAVGEYDSPADRPGRGCGRDRDARAARTSR